MDYLAMLSVMESMGGKKIMLNENLKTQASINIDELRRSSRRRSSQ